MCGVCVCVCQGQVTGTAISHEVYWSYTRAQGSSYHELAARPTKRTGLVLALGDEAASIVLVYGLGFRARPTRCTGLVLALGGEAASIVLVAEGDAPIAQG